MKLVFKKKKTNSYKKKSVYVLFLNKTISKEKRIQFPFCIYFFLTTIQFQILISWLLK